MAHCNSCGGVIGKDCFNPAECAWITERQERETEQWRDNAFRALEGRVRNLEAQLSELRLMVTGESP